MSRKERPKGRPLPPVPKPKPPDEDDYLTPVNRRLDHTYDKIPMDYTYGKMPMDRTYDSIASTTHSADCRIKVQNLPRQISKDMLELYFENKRQFGMSLQVNNVVMDTDGTGAEIAFANPAYARVVLDCHKEKPCVCEGAQLRISRVTSPSRSEDDTNMTSSQRYSAGQFSDEYMTSTDTIEVRGIEDCCTADGLRYYFENKRRSGGGDIVSFNLNESQGYLRIKFTSSQVVSSVCSRQHTVDGCKLTVRPFVFSKTELLLEEIPDNTSEEQILNYLEAKLKTVVTSVTINYENSKALVCFETAYDFHKAVDVCKRHQINHVNMIPLQVPVSSSIIVTNLPEDVTESTVSLYFENTRRSQGGDVARVQLLDANQCIITFVEYSVVSRVLRKADHKIDGKTVSVSPYNEAFDSTGKSESCKLPEPVVLVEYDRDKLKFLKTHKPRKSEVEKQLKKYYAEVIWDDDPVSVECTLEKAEAKHKPLLKTWSDKVKEILTEITNVLKVERVMVDRSIWSEVLNELGTVNVPDSDSVSVFVEQSKCQVVVVGDKNKFNDAWELIEGAINNVKAKEKQKKEQVVKRKELVKWKLNYLLCSEFKEQCENDFKNLKVEVSLEKGIITFTGPKEMVDDALITMFEELQNVRPYAITIGVENVKLLQNDTVHDSVKQKLMEEELVYVWELKGDKLIVYGVEDNHFREIESVVWKSLVKITIPLDSGTEGVIQSTKWKSTEISLRQKFKGCVEIKEGKGQLEIFTIDSLRDQVSTELHDFLSKNSVYKEQMSLTPEVVRYIMHVAKHKFETMKKNLASRGLKLAELDPSGGAVTLEGTTEGIQEGKKMIQSLQDDIVIQQHSLKVEKIGKYLASPKGKECVRKVEKSTPCCVDMTKSSAGSKSGSARMLAQLVKFDQVTCCAEVDHPSGTKLKVFGGDITELQVDVLVNAANRELEHRGGLARVVSKKGGRTIQTECNDRIKQKGRLQCGDVFISNGGHLPCKFVAHASGPNWNGGQEGEEGLLQTAVTRCLQKTVKRKQRSVAFPALCTGIYGYPVDKACTVIVKTVNKFLKGQSAGIKEVIFCDINSSTVCAFIAALQTECSGVQILANVGTQANSSEPSRPSRESDRQQANPNPFGKVQVSVVQALHAKEKVDVLVNSVSGDLDLKKGALSNALLKSAGDVIQTECNTNYPDGINVGEIAVTSGGKLSCSNIFHITIKHYDSSHPSRCLHSVHSCITSCLEKADSMNLSSISFPAIGTGAQKYPKDRIAKQMFKSVDSFVKSSPGTCLKIVRFVIYTADHDTYQAFISEERNWNTDSRQSSRGRSSSSADTKPLGQLVKESRGRAEFRIGKCGIQVYEGDITEERTDSIVASSNHDLDLNKGAVTKALLRKGGKVIQQECDSLKTAMKKEGVVVTTAGQLQCKHIVHVETKRSAWEWKKVVNNVLQKAEQHQFTSVAFPALGTNLGCKPADIATVMCQVITEFQQNGPKFASDIRLVIFQKEMIPDFIEACKSSVKGLSGSRSDRSRQRSHDSAIPKPQLPVKSDESDVQNITIYAESQEKIARAIQTFERTMNDDWKIKNVEDPGICNIDARYVQKMKSESAKLHVDMEIDTDLGKIHMVGLTTNVLQVENEVLSQLRMADRSIYKKNQAQMMSSIVKWMYMQGSKSFPFPDNANLEIETAYKNKQKNVKVRIGTHGEYEIDFNSMTEKSVSNPRKTFPVIRRDLLNDVSMELPKNWSRMKDDEDLKSVSLSNDHKEYKEVAQDLQRTLGRHPHIVNIERIQNRTLYTQYAAKRKLLDQTHPKHKNERILWHGTADYAVASINAQGFNRSYCGKNAVAIGNGVYFAVNANYSDQSTYSPPGQDGNKRMYRCRVLTGKFCAGSSGMRVPPPIDPNNPHILYDSVTNNCSNPVMFVIFNDTQAYPEYIITYK